MDSVTIEIISGLNGLDLENGLVNHQETIVKHAKYISFGPEITYFHDGSGLLMSEGRVTRSNAARPPYMIGRIHKTTSGETTGAFDVTYKSIQFRGVSVLAVGSRFIEGITDTAFFSKMKQAKLVREPTNKVDKGCGHDMRPRRKETGVCRPL